MKQLSDKDADRCGIHAVHHEMDNGELRFRLVCENGSSYILTKGKVDNGWQKSHVHYQKREFYIVEKGFAFIAMLVGGELKIEKLCENDSLAIPVGIAHNVLMSDNAILHTVKFGTADEDWNSCPEMDELLADLNMGDLLENVSFPDGRMPGRMTK